MTAADPMASGNDRDAMRSLVSLAGAVGGDVIEVGSHEGDGALTFLRAGAGRIFCVDNWPDHDVYMRFMAKTEGWAVTPLPDGSLAWAQKWTLRVPLIFIDADHSYEAVLADIKAWEPWVQKGGILAGHDFDPHWPGVMQAVEETGPFRRMAGSSVWWRRVL